MEGPKERCYYGKSGLNVVQNGIWTRFGNSKYLAIGEQLTPVWVYQRHLGTDQLSPLENHTVNLNGQYEN